jgi:hypothetical protein
MRALYLSPLVMLFALGCAGRTDPTADEIHLVLSEPSEASNVNLTRFDTANDWQRARPGAGLTVTATQNPGPTGLSSRFVRSVVGTATPGVEYSLQAGSVNHVELSETTSTGTRVWRSESGSLLLVRDETAVSEFQLTNVIMAPHSGNATGRFKIAGKVAIRF